MNAARGMWTCALKAAFATIAGASMLLCAVASADTLTLKSGRVLEGKITESSDSVLLATPNATISYGKDEITSIQRGPAPAEVYQKRAAAIESSDARGHYELGAYAESKGLIREAHDEYEKAIAADGDHAQAREKLGYVRSGQEWVSREEAMARKGHVRYKGRYVAKGDADDAQASGAQPGSQREMRIVIRGLIETIRRSAGQDRKDAEAKMAGMSDPAALSPLIEAMQDPSAPVRMAALAALLNYREDRAALAVLDAAMGDDDANVRYQGRTILNRKQNRAAFDQAVGYLDEDDDLTRFRASQVLGSLGDAKAIPYLIEKLSWTREGVEQDAPAPQEEPPALTPPSLGTDHVVGLRVKVAPGVSGTEAIVARTDEFGNDYIVNPDQQDTWQNFSSSGVEEILNYDALAALQALTGQNFRFDKDAWQAWYRANASRLLALPASHR